MVDPCALHAHIYQDYFTGTWVIFWGVRWGLISVKHACFKIVTLSIFMHHKCTWNLWLKSINIMRGALTTGFILLHIDNVICLTLTALINSIMKLLDLTGISTICLKSVYVFGYPQDAGLPTQHLPAPCHYPRNCDSTIYCCVFHL